MKRIIVTNNKKVESKFNGKAEVKMMEHASRAKILNEGRELASKGARLLLDPTRTKGAYYNSLVFSMEDGVDSPDEKSIMMIDNCISCGGASDNSGSGKEPLLAGIFQNKDLELVSKILG